MFEKLKKRSASAAAAPESRRVKGIALLCAALLLAFVLLIVFGGARFSDRLIVDADDIAARAAEPTPGLSVRFLDVGQADAALVLCEGQSMLIDGGNAGDSSLIYSVLQSGGIDYLDYIVCTHPHEDHVGGLAGALNYAEVGTAYCSATEYDSREFRNFVRYLDRQGVDITVPKAGDSFPLGSAEVQILGPVRASKNENNNSIVLRIVYGETSFLFAADAEQGEEADLLSADAALQSTVLKVGHHGSDTSSTPEWISAVSPQYAVVSVGARNRYGLPAESVLTRLRDRGVTVFRTDLQGDVTCFSDGTTVTFRVEKNEGADTLAPAASPTPTPTTAPTPSGTPGTQPEAPGITYVANANSGRFHYPDCSGVAQMNEENKLTFTATREQMIAWGYTRCGRCKP